MKSIQIVLVLFAIVLHSLNSLAQQIESRYWYVEKIEVKQKKTTDFENHLSRLATAFVEESFPHTYNVCKNKDNIYYIFHEISGISEIDEIKAIKKQAIENIRLTRAYNKCIESTNTFVIRDLPELNYIPIEPRLLWEEVGFTSWELHTVEQDHLDTYKDKLHDFQSVKDYFHYNDPSFVFEIIEAPDTPTIALMSYARNQIDRKNEDSRIWQVLGPEGRILFENLNPYILDRKYIEFWKLNEVSYIAQAAEESL